MRLGNPRHTYTRKNLREASVKMPVPNERLSSNQQPTDLKLRFQSNFLETASQNHRKPSHRLCLQLFLTHSFSEFTLNTLKLTAVSFLYF